MRSRTAASLWGLGFTLGIHERNVVSRGAELIERRVHRRDRLRQDTRADILEAAREGLREQGAALSLREIARRAGFSPGALYKYFDSKDDLLGALADEAMGRLAARFAAVPTTLPPDERAVELGMAYLEFARNNPADMDIIGLCESVHVDPPSAEHLSMEDTVVGVFREGAALGVFSLSGDDEAEVTAFGAWALVQGLAQFEQRQRPELAARVSSHHRRIIQTFIDGLKNREDKDHPDTSDGGD
jgi:AcrR family transcriptional regulator